jgi:hypothetical protein
MVRDLRRVGLIERQTDEEGDKRRRCCQDKTIERQTHTGVVLFEVEAIV